MSQEDQRVASWEGEKRKRGAGGGGGGGAGEGGGGKSSWRQFSLGTILLAPFVIY